MPKFEYKLDINEDKYIQKQKNGTYRIEVPLGCNESGERKRLVKRVPNKEEAIKIRNEKLEEINSKELSGNSYMSFENLAKLFLMENKTSYDSITGRREKGLAATTLETYRHSLNNYILPYIKDVPINKLTSECIEELYGYLKNDYETNSRGEIIFRYTCTCTC